MGPVLFAHCCANFFVIWSVKYGWATNYSVTHLEEAGPSDLDRLDPMCPFDRAKDWKRVGVLCCYFAQIVSVLDSNQAGGRN